MSAVTIQTLIPTIPSSRMGEKDEMATLPGQRAQFTWALNQYNLQENVEKQAFYARRMAKYIAAAPANNFTADQVTQGKLYPMAAVEEQLHRVDAEDAGPDISEGQALHA